MFFSYKLIPLLQNNNKNQIKTQIGEQNVVFTNNYGKLTIKNVNSNHEYNLELESKRITNILKIKILPSI